MTLKSLIKDGKGSGNLAGVSESGELIVAGEGTHNNTSSFQLLNVNFPAANSVFNFFGPLVGHQFIITSVICDGGSNATQTIYAASNASTTTIDMLLLKFNFRAAGQISINLPFGGFLVVEEGEFVNAFTDGQPVNMNIIGYYHPIREI